MERLTNQIDKYIKQVKKELLEYECEENWREVFTYAEIPYFLTYGFSYNWSINSKNSKYQLRKKEWNAQYDHSRFDKGIYNLDRLAIIEKEISIKDEEKNYFNSIDWDHIETVEFNRIILDGLICELRIEKDKKSLNWNVDGQMNENLYTLIYVIRNWKRELKDF